MLRIGFFYLNFIFSLQALAQVDNGSWMLNGSNTIFVDYNNPDADHQKTTSFNLKSNLGYFNSKLSVFGLGYDISIYYQERDQSLWDSELTMARYSIPVFYRMYFSKGRFRVFGEIQSRFNFYTSKVKFRDDVEQEKDFRMIPIGGFGVDFFLSSNIALEFSSMYSAFRKDLNASNSFYPRPPKNEIQLGLQFFINQKPKAHYASGAALAESYFKKGNSIIGADFRTDFGGSSLDDPIYFKPSFSYFLNDYWKINTAFELERVQLDNDFYPTLFRYGIEVSGQHIKGISKTLFTTFNYGFQYYRSKTDYEAITTLIFGTRHFITTTNDFAVSTGVAFYYFLYSRHVLQSGIDFSLHNIWGDQILLWDSLIPIRQNQLRSSFQLKWQYFLSENIALQLTSKYIFLDAYLKTELPGELETEAVFSTERNEQLEFNFGIQYFLFKKKKED